MSLQASPVSAAATAHGRVPYGFSRRFLTALLLGLLWLIPAWQFREAIAGMFLWDGLLLLAWLVDLLRLPAPRLLIVERQWPEVLSLGRHASVRLELQNNGRAPVDVSLVDETPAMLTASPPVVELHIGANDFASADYSVHPRVRGEIALGRAFLRYRSALGLAEKWAVAPVAQAVRVMPDLFRARNDVLYLIRSRQVEMEKRRRRRRGMGREFEALREYRQGDEMRAVCWPATARRHALVTRTFRMERSQAVWIVLDAGRLMRTQVYDPNRGIPVAKLDYAVDASLSLAQVANQSGDRVGLLVYGRSIQRTVPAGRGPTHLRSLLDHLVSVKIEMVEADHTLAARALLRAQTQRALIVWVTDFAETALVPEVIEHAALMTRRHLVMFAAVSQPDLKRLILSVPETERDMFRYAAALEVADRRERLLRRLRDRGVLTIDMEPSGLADAMLNRYLEIKDRSLL